MNPSSHDTGLSLPLAIGTLTGGGGGSEGNYLCFFHPASGKLGKVTLGARYAEPGFLARHPHLPLLYTVVRSPAHSHGSVAWFRIARGALELVAEIPSGGRNPCHLTVHPGGNLLAVANYDDGTTSLYQLELDGIPRPTFSKRIGGGGPNPERQEGPHAHGAYFSGLHLLVPDLGLDKLHAWEIDPATALPLREDP